VIGMASLVSPLSEEAEHTAKGAICAILVCEPHVVCGSTVPEVAVTVTDPEDLGPDQNLMVNLNKVPRRIKSVVE
jgi:hypothetical protein